MSRSPEWVPWVGIVLVTLAHLVWKALTYPDPRPRSQPRPRRKGGRS